MLKNDFLNTRRSTFDAYEFQEHCSGQWEEVHTDCGYYQMLENKAAYIDNQQRGGNPFRIIKRRLKKAEHSASQLASMERDEMKAKIIFLRKRIEANPDSVSRNRNRTWQIEQATKRLASLN